MTTIVYRDGVLASDSLSSSGSCADPAPFPKIRRLRDGRLFGICGSLSLFGPFLEWLEKGGPRPEAKDSSILVISADGKSAVNYEDGGFFPQSVSPWIAIGSGYAVAQGALHMGASAKRAVQIAALVDNSTGGEVISLSVRNRRG